MRIRDPIHGFVELPNEFGGVVDSWPLQRLRGVRQLALASLVYPGAVHTRFDHTLGVAHATRLMAQSPGIRLSDDELRLVTLAAFLHDVGHGPFSHISEYSLARFADVSKVPAGQKPDKIHELVTEGIITTDPDLSAFLPNGERETVVKLLREGAGRPILRQLVSGPLDADKQDYLLRDSYFCGVRYGVYDLHQLQRSLRALPGGDELCVGHDSVHTVEQFVLAKYYMTANVYRHKVRLITDQMITRAIRLGVEQDRLEEMTRLYRYDASPAFLTNYCQWDDARFMDTFCPIDKKPPGALSGEMLGRLRRRQLLRRVCSLDANRFSGQFRTDFPKLGGKDYDAARLEVEIAVADYLSRQLGCLIAPGSVVLNAFEIKSARESALNGEAEILVEQEAMPRPLSEVSALLQSMNAAFAVRRVEMYAPVQWPDPSGKRRLLAGWEDDIRRLIEAALLNRRNGGGR